MSAGSDVTLRTLDGLHLAGTESLRFCLGSLADLCVGWYTARKSGTEFRDEKYALKVQVTARKARLQFASAARDHVYG